MSQHLLAELVSLIQAWKMFEITQAGPSKMEMRSHIKALEEILNKEGSLVA